MMPLDMALRLASSSSRCEKHKCPFMSECKGDYKTCVMKDIALMLRSQNAEIKTLEATVKGLRDILLGVYEYTREIEAVNKRYHEIILAFQRGYRPKAYVKKPRRALGKFKKKAPEEMDGDERFAYEPPKKEPPPPVVVI